MAPPAKRPKPNFVWEDDAVSLLLQSMLEFKVEREDENVDWETVKTKYDLIHTLFVGNCEGRGFKESTADFTKERVVAKVKSLRLKYKVAVDSGRRSGGGRVVAAFFDQCQQLWGGSPAVESLESGVESGILDNTLQGEEALSNGEDTTAPSEVDLQLSSEDASSTGSRPNPEQDTPTQASSGGRRHKRFERQLAAKDPYLTQMKEDAADRRAMLEHMQKTDSQQTQLLQTLVASSSNLANNIAEGLSSLTAAIAERNSGAASQQSSYRPAEEHRGWPSSNPDNHYYNL